MYCDLFIENNYSKIDILYSYIVPKTLENEVEIGKRAIVSFGKGIRIGLILKICKTYEGDFKDELKEIIDIIDPQPILSNELIDLGLWMKNRYLLGYSKAFSPLLPLGKLKAIKREMIIKKYPVEEELDYLQKLDLKKYYEDLPRDQKILAKKLFERGIIEFSYIAIARIKEKTQKFLRLRDDISLNDLKNLSEKQTLVLNFLKENTESSKKDLMTGLGISNSPIKSLLDKNLIIEFDKKIDLKEDKKNYDYEEKNLNEEQVMAIKNIEDTDKEVSLLYGLTGSGKTEIYLRLAEKVIKDGGDVIVLVPEIGLTPQMIERFKGKFNNEVAIIHSKLSPTERFEEYRKILNGKVHIAVGVRSAVFVPFKNLKLIVVDEFHDSSYKFHDSLKYNTLEIAIRRMKNKGKVILGSATPSVSLYYKASKGLFNLVTLKKRAMKNALMPNSYLVDMREELLKGNLSIFSRLLKDKMREKLEKKEQIILFLNRRGFSNFVSCRSCGHVIKCNSCDISMTYHRTNNRLICHYCGSTKVLPKVCPECGSKYIKLFGLGTQKIEEEVKNLYPEARVLRMDRDTTNSKESYGKYYKMIKDKKVDIIIGTQMISKGFDFPDVTLVGVVAADLSLFISGYEASEDTFQLITQVSGRAGRSYKKGDVIIQSYSPGHYAIAHAAEGSYESFYRDEIKERETFSYPPFKKIISLEFVSANENIAKKWAGGFIYNIGKLMGDLNVEVTKIISLPKIKNLYRCRFSLKFKDEEEKLLLDILKRVLNKSKINEEKDVSLNIEF
ncbi:primosomal protein N' [uncultured Peptoniphilus sp.]|uniref:replication restart helicase PriA n=1 Tax=uncultured Peptoniphilus sp. TaxID=254354 RepID=UPI002803C0B6|nr:primosomal protein N' [uncultured Peptoniphilus sp.]